MQIEIFDTDVVVPSEVHVNIYADEIQAIENTSTGEYWIYTAAIYERVATPVLNHLIHHRYNKDMAGWEQYIQQNDAKIHWVDLRNNKKHVLERWLKFVVDDCFQEKCFYFSLLGINLSNLNLAEFANSQQFNSVYNRFFRSMLQYSLKKFFGEGVVVDHIFHEEGQQSNHAYFDWHTVCQLNQDEALNFACSRVEFLSKDHTVDERSNVIQLCDALLGIFKDVFHGSDLSGSSTKRAILEGDFVQNLFIPRIIKKPKNKNSRYSYADRFNISLFPARSTEADSMERLMNNYYDLSRLELGYGHTGQMRLF